MMRTFHLNFVGQFHKRLSCTQNLINRGKNPDPSQRLVEMYHRNIDEDSRIRITSEFKETRQCDQVLNQYCCIWHGSPD